MGSGKTSLISFLKNRVKNEKIVILSANAVGSLSYLAEQFALNKIYHNQTYREFLKEKYGIYIPSYGSGRLIFSRLMQGMRTDSENRKVRYLLIIDEFKPLLWARSDIRRSVIEHLAHIVNDRTSEDIRYTNILLSLIQRPDQDTNQVFDQFLTISTKKTNIERSTFARRFRDIISLFYNELDISIIGSHNILNAKEINPNTIKEEEFIKLLKPFTFEALIYAARMSGRNPGFCMLLLDDALREVENNLRNMNIDPDKIEIDEKIIDTVSKKRFENERKQLTEDQIKFLQYLENPRKPNEIALKLNSLKIPPDQIEIFISDLQNRGLIEKNTDNSITTTLLWSKGSKYGI